MNISLGIVGLPNVGKSTLFNLLTKNSVPAENYPFCTIDPNVGVVPVADERLSKLAEIVKPQQVIPAVIEFVDIAGLVKGASEGQGLGNQFLSHIREVAAIVHVVRAFNSKDVLHVEESIDPARDADIINTELILKDLDTLTKRCDSLAREGKHNKNLQLALQHLQDLRTHLDTGLLANSIAYPADENAIKSRRELQLLTDKPMLFLVNVEVDRADEVIGELKKKFARAQFLAMDIKLEAELQQMPLAERKELMEAYGVSDGGIDMLTRAAYELLGLISFFTAGEKEVRAWTIKSGETAQQASGAIHTDFTKNFIAADIVKYTEFVSVGGWQGAKDQGKIHLEGKTYIMQDGDVVLFKINK